MLYFVTWLFQYFRILLSTYTTGGKATYQVALNVQYARRPAGRVTVLQGTDVNGVESL